MTDSQDELREAAFGGKTLKENLRNVVAQGMTGYDYEDLCNVITDPDNEDGLDIDEVEEVDKTVNLLSHLFNAHTQKAVNEAYDLGMKHEEERSLHLLNDELFERQTEEFEALTKNNQGTPQ